MKKPLLNILFLFVLFEAHAQTSTWSNPNHNSLYSQLLNKVDTLPLNDGDIEIRLWFHDGNYKVTTTSFLSLTKHNDTWDASYYTFTGSPRRKGGVAIFDSVRVEKRTPVKINYDSIYNQLIKDNILTLNSDSIGEVMDKNGQHEYMWLHSGPTNYTVQVLRKGRGQTVNYRCPKYFYETAKISEFEIPLKIISALLAIIGVKEPC